MVSASPKRTHQRAIFKAGTFEERSGALRPGTGKRENCLKYFEKYSGHLSSASGKPVDSPS